MTPAAGRIRGIVENDGSLGDSSPRPARARRCRGMCVAARAGRSTLACFLFALVGCDRPAPSTPPNAPAPSAASAPAGEMPNLVILSIDTLRADHLGCYGYFRDTSPHIDAFAREAVFFEQAYAPMATTLPSHVSMLTALYPFEHGVTANVGDGGKPFGLRPDLKSFAQVAAAAGYATGGFVSATPLKRPSGFHLGFDVYDEPAEDQAARPAAATNRPALDWLERVSQRPFLLFVHYYDPHVPYAPPAEYQQLFTDEGSLDPLIAERGMPERVEPAPCKGRVATVTRTAINLYDAEIRYVDEQVGRVLERLRALDLWEKSIIVITADHGEGLNQHDWPQHGRIWNEQLHVPLLIRFPQRLATPAQRVAQLVSLVDLIPTLTGRFHCNWAQEFGRQATGVDTLSPTFQQRPLFAQRSGRKCPGAPGGLLAITTPRWRLLYDEEGKHELFSRSDDIHERRNLAALRPELARNLTGEVRKLAGYLIMNGDRFGPEVAGAVGEPSSQFKSQIEALGYTGGSSDSAFEFNEDETFSGFPTLDALRPALLPDLP